QQFTKRVAPDDGTRRGLGDLVDRGGTFSIASTETTSATRLERTEKAGKARWAVSIHIAPGGSATASAVLQAFRARPGPRLEPGNHDALRLGRSSPHIATAPRRSSRHAERRASEEQQYGETRTRT